MVDLNSQQHNIVIIIGSASKNNLTEKAARLLEDEFKKNENITVDIIKPEEYKLNFPGMDDNGEDAKLLKDKVNSASGVILSTPEYHGTFSAMLKLVIENLGYPSALAGKPVGLLGVAGGDIGAIKSLEHLRSVCSHVGALVLPGPVSIANVNRYFDDEGKCTDEEIEKRIRALGSRMLNFIRDHINPKIALEELVRKRSGC